MTNRTRRSHARGWTIAAAPILAGASLFAGGCAHMPLTGAPATGEPLVVDVRTEQHQAVGQKKVGEVVNRDGAGRVVGTSEVYENEIINYNVTYWQVFQGSERLDDEDFFRIGGATGAADEIAATRDNGLTLNRVGLVLLGVGGAATIGGLVLSKTASETQGGVEVTPTWVTGMVGGGLITAAVGGILAAVGAAKVNREHPINDPRRAKYVADQYNKKLGASAPAEGPKKPRFNGAPSDQ